MIQCIYCWKWVDPLEGEICPECGGWFDFPYNQYVAKFISRLDSTLKMPVYGPDAKGQCLP